MLPELEDDEIPAALADTFSRLILDSKAREAMGRRAESLVLKNRGAATRIIELMKPYLRVNSKKKAFTVARSPSK